MKYEDISPTMRLFIGNREGLRRLGFSADDIYCSSARSLRHGGTLSGFLTLRTQGKEFTIECGPIKSVLGFEAEYREVSLAINDGSVSEVDLQRMWEESEVYGRSLSLLAALEAKGLVVPKSVVSRSVS